MLKNANLRMTLLMFLTYFIFAILLNSVGTVIMQVVNLYGVSKTSASALEGFKDITIAVVSFLVASYLPRFGFRHAMMTGLGIVGLACALVPFLPGFATMKVLFFCIGFSFALVKISVYTIAGLVTGSKTAHTSFINTLEGFFMIGVLVGYWMFGHFISPQDPAAWTQVYFIIAALCLAAVLLLAFTRLDETQASAECRDFKTEFFQMCLLSKHGIVLVFIASAFLYVLVEQGIGTWLPTFNNEILRLPAALSVQVASIYAASLAAGRLGAGRLIRYCNWYVLLNICVIATGGLLLIALPLAKDVVFQENVTWFTAPAAAFIMPMIGLFMAPIYPTIISVMLSELPKHRHSAMTGLIVIFSALGGTTGSFITAALFKNFDGHTAFRLMLVPLVAILVALFFFRRHVVGKSAAVLEDGIIASSTAPGDSELIVPAEEGR